MLDELNRREAVVRDGINLEAAPVSFEDAFARLEETVNRLEGSGLTVDEMVARFEEGMTLARLCYERLNAAQARLTVLVRETETFEATELE